MAPAVATAWRDRSELARSVLRGVTAHNMRMREVDCRLTMHMSTGIEECL
jgi:hypothetical protein